MSDKGSKKNGIASKWKAVKPEVDCKVAFIGKWNAGYEVTDEIIETVSRSITTDGGLKTKLRFYRNGLKVGDKSSMFSAFPEQFFPISSIISMKRNEKHTNAVVVVTRTDSNIKEVHVYRCSTEYDARAFVENFERYKVKNDAIPDTAPNDVDNWELRQNAAKKYPTAMIATSVNGINGHDETTKVTVDNANKTMHIQGPEPIYATVNKRSKATNLDLAEQVRILQLENAQLRSFIEQHLVTTYQTVPVRPTEVPVQNLVVLEGNQVRRVTDEASLYGSTRNSTYSEPSSLANSGQFERGSLQYQRRPESINGYAPSVQKEVSTRYLVPADTLRRNIPRRTYVQRKIGDVYKQRVSTPPVVPVQIPADELQYVAESLPPRDSISSLSNSDLEDNVGNGELFEIQTPTPVRYM